MFHGLWFNHGSKTLLQETSHSKALYLLGACDDNLVIAIVKKCNFRILKPGDEEIVDDGDADSNDFHCGYVTCLALFVVHLYRIADAQQIILRRRGSNICGPARKCTRRGAD